MRSCVLLLAAAAFGAVVQGRRISEVPQGATSPEGINWLLTHAQKKGISKHGETGMLYEEVTAGPKTSGKPTPSTMCDIYYKGFFTNGTMIVDSKKRNHGKVSKFAPDSTLKCIGVAMRLMQEGDVFRIWCPAELAFGEYARTYNGYTIAGGSVLSLEVEMVKVGDPPDPRKYPDNTAKPHGWGHLGLESPIKHLNDYTLHKYFDDTNHAMIFYYDSECKACQKKMMGITEFASILEDTHNFAAIDCKYNFKSCGMHNITQVPTIMLHNKIKEDFRPYVGNYSLFALIQFYEATFAGNLKKQGLTANIRMWDTVLDYIGNIEYQNKMLKQQQHDHRKAAWERRKKAKGQKHFLDDPRLFGNEKKPPLGKDWDKKK